MSESSIYCSCTGVCIELDLVTTMAREAIHMTQGAIQMGISTSAQAFLGFKINPLNMTFYFFQCYFFDRDFISLN